MQQKDKSKRFEQELKFNCVDKVGSLFNEHYWLFYFCLLVGVYAQIYNK